MFSYFNLLLPSVRVDCECSFLLQQSCQSYYVALSAWDCKRQRGTASDNDLPQHQSGQPSLLTVRSFGLRHNFFQLPDLSQIQVGHSLWGPRPDVLWHHTVLRISSGLQFSSPSSPSLRVTRRGNGAPRRPSVVGLRNGPGRLRAAAARRAGVAVPGLLTTWRADTTMTRHGVAYLYLRHRGPGGPS